MKAYLDIVKNVLEYGTEKLPERKLEGGRKLENSTIGLPNQIFSHDMSQGFPLLTTKKMSLKNIAIELEGFIKGITDKKWYKERGCNIWNEWANPQKVAADGFEANKNGEYWVKSKAQEQIDDLGPIYGYQWRKFDQHYGEYKTWEVGEPNAGGEFQWDNNSNGVDKGHDQLKNIVISLKDYPNDRRMVCSAWNPNQINMMALPPCHFCWVVTVYNNRLNLFWGQRSCDLPLGVPYNIASYALLLKLLAKVGGFECGNLTGALIDCHIYSNQIEAMKEQVKREPRKLPTLDIICDGEFDIFQWTHSDLWLIDYNPQEKIKMEVTV